MEGNLKINCQYIYIYKQNCLNKLLNAYSSCGKVGNNAIDNLRKV